MLRKVIPELLDDDVGSPAEIAASLADLQHINAWFGGIRTTVALLQEISTECGCNQLSMLEVASGAGDLPMSASRILARQGREIRVTLLDRRWSHLPRNGAPSIAADALALPFRDGAFDVVSCSLFAHHLEPEELRRFAEEAMRVSRRAVLINDLIRSRLHLWLVYAGLPLFSSHITWHDAPASVRRAYTTREMREILRGVPAKRITVDQQYLYRMGVLLWKD